MWINWKPQILDIKPKHLGLKTLFATASKLYSIISSPRTLQLKSMPRDYCSITLRFQLEEDVKEDVEEDEMGMENTRWRTRLMSSHLASSLIVFGERIREKILEYALLKGRDANVRWRYQVIIMKRYSKKQTSQPNQSPRLPTLYRQSHKPDYSSKES